MEKRQNRSYGGVVGKGMGLAILILTILGLNLIVNAQEIQWVRQFGSPSWDDAYGIATDSSGNVYVVGDTEVTLPDQVSAGSTDAFIRKYDSEGNELWTRQFGSSLWDYAIGTAIDSSRNVYVVGGTEGALPGQVSAGSTDAFIRKYDSEGNELWTRQFGSPSWDGAASTATDSSGNSYVIGTTWGGILPGQVSAGSSDVYLRKYDSNGNELWTRQFGTPLNDNAGSVVNSSGNVYVVGGTEGVLPGQVSTGGWDVFIRKYDSEGSELWTRQFGTPLEDGQTVIATDSSGNIYVAGGTEGTLPGQVSTGSIDAFVRRYDSEGNELWTRQFGTPGWDDVYGAATDSSGNVYVFGETEGAFPWQVSAGGWDVYLRKYDSEGNELWTEQYGTSEDEWPGYGVGIDISGNIYFCGTTFGEFSGQTSAGDWDAFIVKILPYIRTPQQQIELLIANVESLTTTGILNQGQGNALTSKLEAATAKLDQSNENAAVNLLQAFINQIKALIKGGVLSVSDGQPLIDSANDIINLITG